LLILFLIQQKINKDNCLLSKVSFKADNLSIKTFSSARFASNFFICSANSASAAASLACFGATILNTLS
jgi:hypothetical protein